MAQIFQLAGGAALFLFGLSLMGEGLQALSAGRLSAALSRLSGSSWRCLLLGLGGTALIQSSAAAAALAVGLVNAGRMRTRQAIAVILGAMLGTSVTGWLFCLGGAAGGLAGTALPGLAAVAGILLRLPARRPARRGLGDVLLGLAVLLFGLSAMGDAAGVLAGRAWLAALLRAAAHPLPGILAGVVLGALLQSASAAVGMLQALSLAGGLRMDAALPLLMGIAVGAAAPVLLAALGTNIGAKRAAAAYPAAAVLGTAACAALFYMAEALFHFPFLTRSADPLSLALANTLFRLGLLGLLVPFLDVLEELTILLVPEAGTRAG